MTLNEYVTEVIDTNPIVREQVHVYREVVQDLNVAVSGWRPSLDFTASVGEVSRKAANTQQRRTEFDSSQADLSLTQNLFSGFDTTNQIKQARAHIASAAFRLYDTADNIALEAVRAYLNVLSEKRLVDLAAQNVESHDRILSQIRELSDRGIIRRSDVEQTEGRLARAQASLIAQQNNLEDALTELHKLLGRYLDPAELTDPTLPVFPADPIEALINASMNSHPAIQSAQKNIEAARYEYKRSRSTNYPSVDLRVQQGVGNDNDGPTGRSEEGSIMLSLRYNLFRGGADRAEQRKRISSIHENKAFLDRVRRQTIDALRLAWTADRSIQDQLPYLTRHSEKSLETVGLYREEFLLQRRDLIDLLDAEGELNRALSQQAEAKYTGLTARYRIYEALGALLPVLDLNVDLSYDDLNISNLRASALDPVEVTTDRDADTVPDDQDQCDNTRETTSVDIYGCRQQRALKLGYTGVGETLQAVNDSFSIATGERLVFSDTDLVANDRSPDGDVPRLISLGSPLRGAISRDADSNLVYTPTPGFSGNDEFDYTVGDNRGRVASAKVTITLESRMVPEATDGQIVRFNYKQLTLTDESQARFDAVVERLLADPDLIVEVLAYTDNVGSAAYNRRLSEHRADVLRRMLVNAGIDAGRIEAVGMGENDPIADNATEEGRALNRRGEFRLKSAGGQ